MSKYIPTIIEADDWFGAPRAIKTGSVSGDGGTSFIKIFGKQVGRI